MGWLKLDDNVSHHRKMLSAGDVACWLWVCGLAYCQRHSTDGRIPKPAAPFLGCAGWKVGVRRLLEVSLWFDDGEFYMVHDYLAWNDSAEDRRRKSDDRNARVTRFRERQQRDGNAAPHPTPHPTPTPPPPSPDGDGRASVAPGAVSPVPVSREGVADRYRAMHGQTPMDWARVHSRHVAGFCDGFVCFPQSKFDELATRVTSTGVTVPEAREQVMAWAQDVRARWAGKIPGDGIFDFWQNEWALTHGSNRPSSVPKPGAGLDALIGGSRG